MVWKNKDKVFYEFEELKDVDARTFKYLRNNYFKDTNGVYFINKKMDADPFTFTADYTSFYACDKNYIYQNGEPIFKNDGLWKTTKTVYKSYSFGGSTDRMDALLVKKLSGKYSMDKNAVYYEDYTVPISKQNFDKIRVFDNFIIDGEKIYKYYREFNGQKLDAQSFVVIPVQAIYTAKTEFIFQERGIKKTP